MSANLQSFAQRVNELKAERKERNQKIALHKLEVEEELRQGDLRYQNDAEWLLANGYLSPDVKIKYTALPQGYVAFKKRKDNELARSAATERGEASEKRSYLYENLNEKNGLESPLVIPAKSQSRFIETLDRETGVVERFTPNSEGVFFQSDFDPKVYRFEKYALQSQAREILKDITRQKSETVHVPAYRVCDCLRNSLATKEGVGIVSSSSQDRTRFAGLQTCGSVWHCPVCAARISETRSDEIRFMCDMWQASGGGVILVTNTVRHGYHDDLTLLLDVMFGIVWNRYINHRAYKQARKTLGYLGRVRAVEVTWGKNGWHPHIHEIWLVKKPLTAKELHGLETTLYECWNTTLVNAGLRSVTRKHGVTVKPGSNAAEYVAKFGRLPKWDTSKELTKSHLKTGKESQTPFDLLRASLAGDSKASYLFRQYAVAFAGRRQLYYSTGLKDYFQLRERTDIEIAASNDDVLQVLAVLTNEQWKRVLQRGNRATILNIAEAGGADAIQEYINGLQ